jgi:hypothetical protein
MERDIRAETGRIIARGLCKSASLRPGCLCGRGRQAGAPRCIAVDVYADMVAKVLDEMEDAGVLVQFERFRP